MSHIGTFRLFTTAPDVMTPISEFVFRLPSASAMGTIDNQPVIAAAGAKAGGLYATDRSLLSPSTLALVRLLDTFETDCILEPTQTVEHHISGTVTEIAEWLRTTRPRHWSAAVRNLSEAGSLWHMHWLRAMCSEMFLGGQVSDGGRWCLHLRGTMNEQCQSDPDRAIDKKTLSENEYLSIAIIECTTMLLQLYTDKKWNA